MQKQYTPSAKHARILARDPGQVAELPWHQGTGSGTAEGHAICSGPMIIANVSGNGYPAGKGWSPDSHAAAAFIVKAANSHAALCEVLRLAHQADTLQHAGIDLDHDFWSQFHAAINTARAAVA